MKYLVVLCLAIAVAQAQLTDEQAKKLSSHSSECLAQSKADPAQVQNLKNGAFDNVNDALKQYALCVMMKAELINAAGVLNKDVALAKTFVPADKPAVDKIFTECQSLTKPGKPEDIAWTFSTCFHQKSKKYSVYQ